MSTWILVKYTCRAICRGSNHGLSFCVSYHHLTKEGFLNRSIRRHGILQSRGFHIESMQARIDRRIYASRQVFAQASNDYQQMSAPERIKFVGPFVLDGLTLGASFAPQATRVLSYTSAGLAYYTRRMPVFDINRWRGFLGESFVPSQDSLQLGGAVRGSVEIDIKVGSNVQKAMTY